MAKTLKEPLEACEPWNGQTCTRLHLIFILFSIKCPNADRWFSQVPVTITIRYKYKNNTVYSTEEKWLLITAHWTMAQSSTTSGNSTRPLKQQSWVKCASRNSRQRHSWRIGRAVSKRRTVGGSDGNGVRVAQLAVERTRECKLAARDVHFKRVEHISWRVGTEATISE